MKVEIDQKLDKVYSRLTMEGTPEEVMFFYEKYLFHLGMDRHTLENRPFNVTDIFKHE